MDVWESQFSPTTVKEERAHTLQRQSEKIEAKSASSFTKQATAFATRQCKASWEEKGGRSLHIAHQSVKRKYQEALLRTNSEGAWDGDAEPRG